MLWQPTRGILQPNQHWRRGQDPGGVTVNYLLKSEAFDNAAWTKGAFATISANATAAPDSTTTADLVYPSGNNTDQTFVQQQMTLATGQYTNSIHAKPSSWQWLSLSIYDGAHHRVWFDILNGTVGTQEAGITGAIASAANGFFRCSVTRTITGANPYAVFMPVSADNSLSTTASGTNGVYLWGAQFETGASATTYTPNL